MSVSGISGGSNALYFTRLSGSGSSQQASGSKSSSRPSGPPPGPPPDGQGQDGPPGLSDLPDSLQSSLSSIFEDSKSTQTSFDDVKKKVTSAIDEYKKTDEYAALSDDDKAAITKFEEGPKKREEEGRSSVLGQLDSQGSDLRSQILAQLGVTDSSTDQDLTSVLAQLQQSQAQAA